MKTKITKTKSSAAKPAPNNKSENNAASDINPVAAEPSDNSPSPPKTAPDAPLADPIKHWVGNITKAFAGHVGGDVEAGLQLIKAKGALEHGHWLKLFKNGGLPFNERIAQKLMAIAKNEYFANPKNYSYLPVRREVAYQLSDLPPGILEAGVKEGRITPKMSIRKAVEFTEENGGVSKQAASAERQFDKTKSLSRLGRFLKKEFDSWPIAEIEELVSAFDGFIAALECRAS